MALSPAAADRDYPKMIAETDHAEPAPRRIRARLGGELIFDTTRARCVREWAYYPQGRCQRVGRRRPGCVPRPLATSRPRTC